ncbi:hypothetical protein DTO164E3_5689 [Paecilomyces variotii]|nr:hypothetical protein DTO164E3_5689 [Paecilomyces variotii]KAJ9220779.1 hypothetical protein DTO169C6_6864 [Paecilomyces variotii]KAJ9356172.1 hypothetical protein DTO027B9_3714 [Paecilomyces variotii]
MICLPPTRIELTDSDIDFHLQGIMLRRGLVADFGNLDIGSDDEDEDDDDYTQFPRMYHKSDISSSAAASTSDILPDSESSGGSHSSQGYQATSYGRSVIPQTPSAGISQLDGVSVLDYTALHVENAFQGFPAGLFDDYGRQFPGNNKALTALLAYCLYLQRTYGSPKHNNDRIGQKSHFSGALQQILSIHPSLSQYFASVPDLLPYTRLIASSVGSSSYLTAMARDKRPPRVPGAQRPARQTRPPRTIAPGTRKIVSAGEPGQVSRPPTSAPHTDASVMKIATPARVNKRGQEAVNKASVTSALPAPAHQDLALRQELEDPFLVPLPGKEVGGHRTSIGESTAIDAGNISSSSPHSELGLTAGGHHTTLPPILPGSLYAFPYFQTAYDRTILGTNTELGNKDVPSAKAGSYQPSFGPFRRTDEGPTRHTVTTSSRTEKHWPIDTENYAAFDHCSPPSKKGGMGKRGQSVIDAINLDDDSDISMLNIKTPVQIESEKVESGSSFTDKAFTSAVPSKKDSVLSIHHLLNPENGTESAEQALASNAPNYPKQDNDVMGKSKTPNHPIYGPSQVHISENEDDDRKAAAEALAQLSTGKQAALPPGAVASCHRHDTFFQHDGQSLTSDSPFRGLSSGSAAERDSSPAFDNGCLASPKPELQAALLQEMAEKRRKAEEARGPKYTRESVDEATWQSVLEASWDFQRRIDKMLADIDKDDDSDDFGLAGYLNLFGPKDDGDCNNHPTPPDFQF